MRRLLYAARPGAHRISTQSQSRRFTSAPNEDPETTVPHDPQLPLPSASVTHSTSEARPPLSEHRDSRDSDESPWNQAIEPEDASTTLRTIREWDSSFMPLPLQRAWEARQQAVLGESEERLRLEIKRLEDELYLKEKTRLKKTAEATSRREENLRMQICQLGERLEALTELRSRALRQNETIQIEARIAQLRETIEATDTIASDKTRAALEEMAQLVRKQEDLLRTLSRTLHTSNMHPDVPSPLPSTPSRTSRESSPSNIDSFRAKHHSTSVPVRAKQYLRTRDHHAPQGVSSSALSLPPLEPEESASAATRARWSRLLNDAKEAASSASSSRHALSPSPSTSRLSSDAPILPLSSAFDLSKEGRFIRLQNVRMHNRKSPYASDNEAAEKPRQESSSFEATQRHTQTHMLEARTPAPRVELSPEMKAFIDHIEQVPKRDGTKPLPLSIDLQTDLLVHPEHSQTGDHSSMDSLDSNGDRLHTSSDIVGYTRERDGSDNPLAGWEGEKWTDAWRDVRSDGARAERDERDVFLEEFEAVLGSRSDSSIPEPKSPLQDKPTKGRISPKARKAASVARRKKALKAEETHSSINDRTVPHLLPNFESAKPKSVVKGELLPRDGPVLSDLASPSEHKPIATLAHGLDRVLFNPGVHWLQDPRSRVYNFPPWLQTIPKVEDFAFERLQGFVKSSEDDDLRTLAVREGCQYTGSTSSLSGFLSHIYFLMSGDREVNTAELSQTFSSEPRTFTPGQRMPSTLLMNWKDGVYALDTGWGGPALTEKTILTWMGTMLENFLTKDETEFSQLLRANRTTEASEEPQREAYRFSKSNKFVMRSQLDCVDRRLPGTGVFDIKTRAALPIRMDQMNYVENSGYQIRQQHGLYESFEREYYDLIRSAFLKYSFQVRIGNMDGVLVAYHNTAKLFGFQYISLDAMDAALFGNPGAGWPIFDKSIALMEAICDKVAKQWPEQSIRLLVDKREGANTMKVFALLHEWDGAEDQRPIAEFDVTVRNFLDGEYSPGPIAIRRCLSNSWTLKYSIALSGTPASASRARLAETRARQERAWALPSGMSLEDMADRFTEIDHGGSRARALAAGVDPPSQVRFMESLFSRPSKAVKKLRTLAREGREREEARKEAEKDLPKVVWSPAPPDNATASEGVSTSSSSMDDTLRQPEPLPSSSMDDAESSCDIRTVPQSEDTSPPEAMAVGSLASIEDLGTLNDSFENSSAGGTSASASLKSSSRPDQ